MSIEERITKLVERLQETSILLVEWETTLFIRLGYPRARDGCLFLLTPDEELPVVRGLAAECGLQPETSESLKPAYPCESADGALRFLATSLPPFAYAPQPRLVFAPLSWTGLRADELAAIPADGAASPPPRTPLGGPPAKVPRNVQTVPLSATCAALARIYFRETTNSRLRSCLIDQLLSVLIYNLIDNSYEGNYVEFPSNDVPLSAQERQEIDQAVSDIRQWTLRPEDERLKEELVAIITGKIAPHALYQQRKTAPPLDSSGTAKPGESAVEEESGRQE